MTVLDRGPESSSGGGMWGISEQDVQELAQGEVAAEGQPQTEERDGGGERGAEGPDGPVHLSCGESVARLLRGGRESRAGRASVGAGDGGDAVPRLTLRGLGQG